MSQTKVCMSCWQGTIVGGVCTSCHRKASTERRPDALPPLSKLNMRYSVGEVLGNGGFGITYSVWDNKMQRRVALKEFYPRQDVYRGSDSVTVVTKPGQENIYYEMFKRFESEAKLLQLMNGEEGNIQIYDLFYANNTVYYAMEFLEGGDLKSYIKSHGPMSWDVLGPMMYQLLFSLDSLHRKNLIHRDIKPDNLFLTKENRIRLIDFGSVRTFQGNESFTVCVTHHFAPWEQYETNGNQGPWTDVYALSVTLYMLLSGKLPPKAPERKAGAKVIPLKTHCPHLPQEVCAAIEKGMSVRIEDRYPSAREFRKALFPHMSGGSHGGYNSGGHSGGSTVPGKTDHIPFSQTAKASQFWLHCLSGVHAGKKMRLGMNQEIKFGRRSTNEVRFPDSTNGVSRAQCSVFVTDKGVLFVRDTRSTYGTYLNNTRLGEEWVEASPGSILRFGNEIFQLAKH